jgi:hypothetical protein
MRRRSLILLSMALAVQSTAAASAEPRCPPGSKAQRSEDVFQCIKKKGGKAVRHGPYRRIIAVTEDCSHDGDCEHTPEIVLEKGSYRNGLKHGIWSSRSEPALAPSKGTYRHGKRVGRWVEWSANRDGDKIKRVGTYLAGRRQGVWRSFYENGRRHCVGGYQKGIKQGRWGCWYKNRRPKSVGRFRQGKKHGK